jgi:signal transduction histidine kinase
VGRLRDALGIRLIDVGATLVVITVVELNIATGGGPGAAPLNSLAYVLGAILALPILLRRKWPLQVLIACTVLLFIYYSAGYRRNISPAPLLSLPLYDAALAGYLAVAIVIPAVYMCIGLFVVGATTHPKPITLVNEFLPSVVVLALAIMLGDTVRSRRALAAETADRLRLAEEEREAETARRVAEERLRIARELHDTVAHSMATITVQAGSALRLPAGSQSPEVQAALTAIRQTSKSALAEMRVTLGQLRGNGAGADPTQVNTAQVNTAQINTAQIDTAQVAAAGGLDRLPALSEAVRAAGAPVSVSIEGAPVPLPPGADHAAYRILQESLTNVLRHAGPRASAAVRLCYQPDALTIEVTDDGPGPAPEINGTPGARSPAGASSPVGAHLPAGGHGLTGMAERAAAVGGQLTAGPRPDGGFGVLATLPLNAPVRQS